VAELTGFANPWRWPIYTANGQMVLVAVFENGWGPNELAAKPGRVLDLNGRKNRLEPTGGHPGRHDPDGQWEAGTSE
jgi:hypothetical protein